ncbi:MAG: hypothetical protein LAP85_28055 [Acidobacteriia bacterium]|nr:hypothetical protein [Terriglobia bacterium]
MPNLISGRRKTQTAADSFDLAGVQELLLPRRGQRFAPTVLAIQLHKWFKLT